MTGHRERGQGRDDWVVVIEVEGQEGVETLEVAQLERLLALLFDHSPAGLWSVDRYALQLVVPADSPEAALVSALSWWRQAMGRLDLPQWRLVRAEIKTPAELEAEHRAGSEPGLPRSAAPTSEDALREAYLATRRLLACRSRREAAEVVTDLVQRLGAEVVGAAGGHPHALPFDLSLGESEPRYPAADPISIARLQVEEVLPALLLDAARVIRLVEPPLLIES